MKSQFAIAMGLGLTAVPVAGASQVGDGLFETLEECTAASTAADNWGAWSYTCVPTTNGFWTLEWTRDSRNTVEKKVKRTR